MLKSIIKTLKIKIIKEKTKKEKKRKRKIKYIIKLISNGIYYHITISYIKMWLREKRKKAQKQLDLKIINKVASNWGGEKKSKSNIKSLQRLINFFLSHYCQSLSWLSHSPCLPKSPTLCWSLDCVGSSYSHLKTSVFSFCGSSLYYCLSQTQSLCWSAMVCLQLITADWEGFGSFWLEHLPLVSVVVLFPLLPGSSTGFAPGNTWRTWVYLEAKCGGWCNFLDHRVPLHQVPKGVMTRAAEISFI